MVDKNLKDIIGFMQSRRMLHFDAHFRNILTDGHNLYFADFGLATSLDFKLSKHEIDFFEKHRNYDRFYSSTIFVNCLVAQLFNEKNTENTDKILYYYTLGYEKKELPRFINLIIKSYAPIAIIMNKFLLKLRQESKLTPYPASDLEKFLPNFILFEELSSADYNYLRTNIIIKALILF